MATALVALITAIGTAAAAGATTGILAGSALWGLTTVGVLVAAAVSVVGGLIMTQLQLASMPSLRATEQIRQSTAAESALQRWRVIGQTKISGSFLLYDVSEDDELYHLVHFASHECHSIEQHFLNNELVTLDEDGWVQTPAKWLNLVQIQYTLGDHTSDPFPLLREKFAYFTLSSVGYEMAMVLIRQKRVAAGSMQKVYPGTGRLQWHGIVNGDNNVYDPRDDTYGFTRNAAIHVLGHLTRPTIDNGCAVAISDVDLDSFAAWADVCDESVPGLGGAAPRYQTDGLITYGDDPMPTLQALLQNCDADIYLTRFGKLALRGSNAAVTQATTFTQDHVIAMDWSTRSPAWRRANRVIAKYLSPDHNYQETTAPPVDRALDTNEARRPATMDLTFCANSRQAQVLAKKQLIRVDPRFTGRVVLTIAGIVASPTGTVFFDFPEAPQVAFRVARRTIGEDGLSVTLDLESIDADYDVFLESEEQSIPSLPAISVLDGVLSAPDVTSSYTVELPVTSGLAAAGVVLVFTPLTDELITVELQVAYTGTSNWQTIRTSVATSGIASTGSLEDGRTYDTRIRFLGPGGGASAWTVVSGLLLEAGVPIIPGFAVSSNPTSESAFSIVGSAPDVVTLRSIIVWISDTNDFSTATDSGEHFLSPAEVFSYTYSPFPSGATRYVWITVTNVAGVEGPEGPVTVATTT